MSVLAIHSLAESKSQSITSNGHTRSLWYRIHGPSL